MSSLALRLAPLPAILLPAILLLLVLPTGSAGEDPPKVPEGDKRGTAPEGSERSIVRLRSQPGVEILWEGVALGETDAGGLLVIEEIPSGEYRLTLSKQGFHELDIRITVEQGTSSSRDLLLEPLRPHRGTRETSEKVAAESRMTSRETTVAEPAGDATVAEQAEETNGNLSPVPESGAGSGSTVATTGATVESAAHLDVGVPAEIAPGLPFSPFLGAAALLLALLAGAAGARFLPRSRKAAGLSQAPPRRALDIPSEGEEIPLFEGKADRDAPRFLEDLKQRERNLEEVPDTAPRRQEETIIEVEAVEIRPGEAR